MKQQPSITKYLLIFSISLLNHFNAFPQNYKETIQNNITLDLSLRTNLNTVQMGKLKELTSRYYFVPQSDIRQKVISIDYFSNPKADSIDPSKSKYFWNELHDNYTVWYHSKIKTSYYQYPIGSSPFPLKQIPDSLQKYISFDNIIDTNKRIKELTLSLTKDESELFPAVFKIGKWIYKNIRYVSTGNKTIEKASVVYRTKFGDCDELSVLFLSMLRTAQIPSRLVSGVAKGNKGFYFHAWIEVYFDKLGWIPFDATSGQFGYADQSHIKLGHHKSNEKILLSEWEFYPYFGDVQIQSKELPEISVQLNKLETHNIKPFGINVHPHKSEIGINAYLPAVVTSWNKTPFFTSNKITILDIDGVEIIGNAQFILDYAPYEKKELKLLLKMVDKEPGNYSYSSFLIAFDQFGVIDSTSITFTTHAKRLSIEKANAIIDTLSWSPPILDLK